MLNMANVNAPTACKMSENMDQSYHGQLRLAHGLDSSYYGLTDLEHEVVSTLRRLRYEPMLQFTAALLAREARLNSTLRESRRRCIGRESFPVAPPP